MLVVHRKWALISIFQMTSRTQCISSRHRLCRVVPRGELLISLHYYYRSTRWIGGGGQVLLKFASFYLRSRAAVMRFHRLFCDVTWESLHRQRKCNYQAPQFGAWFGFPPGRCEGELTGLLIFIYDTTSYRQPCSRAFQSITVSV